MCGLRTSPRTDVDPPRVLVRTVVGGRHIVSLPRGDTLFYLRHSKSDKITLHEKRQLELLRQKVHARYDFTFDVRYVVIATGAATPGELPPHRGKWGQLTPWKMKEKFKMRKHAKNQFS